MVKRILIIDDSVMIRKLVSSTLQTANFDVSIAEDGADALERLKTYSPMLIICDFNMPRLNGIEFVRTIRNDERFQAHKFVPVLMLTTESTEDKVSLGMAAGVSSWMVKPFMPERLLSVVHKMIGDD